MLASFVIQTKLGSTRNNFYISYLQYKMSFAFCFRLNYSKDLSWELFNLSLLFYRWSQEGMALNDSKAVAFTSCRIK